MRVVETSGYTRWRARTVSDQQHGEEAEVLLLAMEQRLVSLWAAPLEETAMLRRVVQARRHELWRVSHPYRRGLALRIICFFPDEGTVCFFPDEGTVVLALMGFNKHPVGDSWYSRVAQEGQAIVDQYLREQQQAGGAP